MAYEICTLILAAGEGRRLSRLTGGIPKQFWRPPGDRTLLEGTVDRFAPLAAVARRALVVGDGHEGHLRGSSVPAQVGTVVVQPRDRGTATGVLLGLMALSHAHPDDPVVITPSDHGVGEQLRFRTALLAAARHAADHDELVVFGAEPNAACPDYGWITPGGGPCAMGPIRPVTSFVEKPGAEIARRLFAAGAVWNTMVVVARMRTLRDLYARLLPDLYDALQTIAMLEPTERPVRLADLYAGLAKSYDFSRDVLAHATGLATYVLPASVGWTDLGTPDRLWQWHRQPARAGLRPADTSSPAAASA